MNVSPVDLQLLVDAATAECLAALDLLDTDADVADVAARSLQRLGRFGLEQHPNVAVHVPMVAVGAVLSAAAAGGGRWELAELAGQLEQLGASAATAALAGRFAPLAVLRVNGLISFDEQDTDPFDAGLQACVQALYLLLYCVAMPHPAASVRRVVRAAVAASSSAGSATLAPIDAWAELLERWV